MAEPGVKPRKWVFRTSMQDNFQVETILNYAKTKGWDAIGMMHDTTGYGTASKETADKLIPAGGFKILATETYNIGDTDMTSQLQKMQRPGSSRSSTSGSVRRTPTCCAARRRSTTRSSSRAPGA